MSIVHRLPIRLAAAVLGACLAGPLSAASLVASYDFNNTLAAHEGGKPSLVAVDPLGLNSFSTAVVNGQSRRVYGWSGDGSDPTRQAGLRLDTTGLVTADSYSVALTFEFSAAATTGGGWRRIMDTQNRQSDSGFYVDPLNRLSAVEKTATSVEVVGTTTFTTPGFHEVVITVTPSAGRQQVQGWLDGRLELTREADFFSLSNANNPGHLLYFFADNLNPDAPNEFANGRIASLRLYEGAFIPTPVPEPATWALMAGGLLLLAGRKRQATARH